TWAAVSVAPGSSRPRVTLRQEYEARIVSQRLERGVDPVPAGRQRIRSLEQWLQPSECFLGLTKQNIDARQEVLEIRAVERIPADRHKLDCTFPFGDRLGSSPEI